jgi:hypothetical protein
MMNILPGMISTIMQAGHLVTVSMMALIPTMRLRIIIPQAISVQLLVGLLPWMGVEAQ